jgi:hypothetical protein
MKPLPRWVVIWFVLSTPLILWDIGFVLLRPMSMAGGALAFLWKPYVKYITVDLSYGDLANGFVKAQAIMTAIEVLMLAAAVVAFRAARRPLGTLLVFAVSLLTCMKTFLIFLIELVTRGEHVGHNAASDLFLLYVLPNAFWVVMPGLVAWTTGKMLLRNDRGV